MQTKTITPVSSRHKWKKTAYLLVISALLLVLGLAAMFSLGTASVRFDNAYDNGTDLSPYFFEPLAEAIVRDNLAPRIICESDGTMAEDALAMKGYWRRTREGTF